MNSSEPWRLLRFQKPSEYLLSEIETGQLYCSAPSRLNDPFDCRVDWQSSFSRVLELPNLSDQRRKQLELVFSAFQQRDPHLEAGICCFTINADNQLMWAHYAENYQGVCLYYEIPQTYLWDRYPDNGSDFHFVGGSQVYYGDNSFSAFLTEGDLLETSDEPTETIVARMFTSKSKSWEHEEEFRVVTSKPGTIKLQPDFLKEVTFGFRTPDSLKFEIERSAQKANPSAIVGQLTRSRHSDFRLNFPGHDL